MSSLSLRRIVRIEPRGEVVLDYARRQEVDSARAYGSSVKNVRSRIAAATTQSGDLRWILFHGRRPELTKK